tara:strand:- start:5412 stop:6518 length:1107 start_codon:yes stop_codon:yes gene_type:complete
MDPRLAQALIGAAPEDNSPDQLAIAQALAQQNRWGNLMSMSGDRALAPAGAAMVRNVAGQREGLQKARQGQAQRALTAEENQLGRDLTIEEDALQRASQEGQWAEDNRLKQMQIEAQKEEAAARLAAAEENRRINNEFRQRAEKDKRTKEDYRHLDNFNNRIEDNHLVDLSGTFQTIDQALSPYGSFNDENEFIKKADEFGKPVDIPGLGFGEGSLRLAMRKDPEASGINAAFWTLYNGIINDISGAAVSGDEFIRVQNALLGKTFNTEAQQLEGIKLIRKAYMAKLRHSMSAMGDRREAVLQQYTRGMPEKYLYGMEKYMPGNSGVTAEGPAGPSELTGSPFEDITDEEWASYPPDVQQDIRTAQGQ